MTDDAATVSEVDFALPIAPGAIVWSWDEPPTREDVQAALATLPDVHGVPMATVIDHTISIPNKEKVRDADGRESYKMTWKLYVQVAGREAQLWLAVAENAWRVEFVPEEDTPKGLPPGIIHEDPWVYRESVIIRDADQNILHRATGTAKFGGGSFPWEKAETGARGRALGSLGFGVLPGSGIASAEEMQEVAAMPARTERKAPPPPKDRKEWMVRFRERREQLRLARDISLEEANIALAAHIHTAFQKVLNRIPDDENAEFDWSGLTDAELTLIVRNLEGQLHKLSEASEV